MRIWMMATVVVAAVGCGPAIPQSTPPAATGTTASPSTLTLESARCAETTEADLPDAETIHEARGTDPNADGPTELRDLLEGQAAAAGEAAATTPDDILELKAQQWRALLDAFEADGADAGGSDEFRYGAGGMEVRAVRLAGAWFISAETHAMPDSFCEGDEPEDVVEEPVELECDGDLTEEGHLDYEAGASGASDDPLVVARDWVGRNLAQPSQVTLAHIAADDGPLGDDVAVLREGRTVALLDLMLAEGDSVLVTSYVVCPTDLAGHSGS